MIPRVLLGLAAVLLAGCAEGDAQTNPPAAKQPQADHAVVLVLHHVATDTPASTSVTPRQFDAQLDYIDAHGFNVLPLTQIVEALRNAHPLPDNTVALTFDDAYESVFHAAHPRLTQRGWPYTVFVSSGAIDQGLKPYMSWAQLKTLAEAGVELGNHSHSHAHLVARQPEESARQWRQRVEQDIGTAQQRIRAETGQTPTLFAYPYGEYTAELAALVEGLGFIGLGQHSGAVSSQSDFNALPRFPVGGDYTDLSRLATRLRSRALPVYAEPEGPLILTPGAASLRPALELHIPSGPYNLGYLACYASGQGQMTLTALDKPGAFRIQPGAALGVGRSKYNCTAPHQSDAGVYYWWSYLIMRPHGDGNWYKG